MLTPMRAVFVGDGSLVVRCAEAFARAGHVVVRVASADPQVLAWAQDEGLPSEQASEVPRLEGDDFDWLFSIGWLHRLPPPLLARARRLALNFHDGPLPRHGGLNAPAWALLEGCRHHGVTWHEMTPALDAGRIACELSFDLSPDETAFSLATHCHEAGYQSFLTLLAQITQGALVLRAPSGAPRLHGRHQRPAALGTLDWRRPAAELAVTVRALDFGPLPNPLGCAKVLCEGRLLRVGGAQEATRGEWEAVAHGADPHGRDACDADPGDEVPRERAEPARTDPHAWRPAEPGTVLAAREGALWLATGRGVLRLEGLQAVDGGPLPALSAGARLDALAPHTLQRLAQARPALARAEAAWRPRLIALAQAQLAQLPHPRLHPASASPPQPFEVVLPAQAPLQDGAPHDWLAACAAWLAAVSGEAAVGLRWRDPALARASEGLQPFACGWWPLLMEVHPGQRACDLRETARSLLSQAQADGPVSADLRWRLGRPAPALPVFGVCVGDAPQDPAFDAPEVCLMVPADAGAGGCGPAPWRLRFDARLWPVEVASEIAAQLGAWMHRFAGCEGALSPLSLLPAQDEARLEALNDTAVPADLQGGVWQAVARGLARQPREVALEWEGGCLDRGGLLEQVRALSADLRRQGLAPGEVVGVCLPRGPALVASVLAVLACGGAYLPLDPHYPAERLRFMCRDAGLRRVLGGAGVADLLGLPPDTVISPQPAGRLPEDPLPEPDAPAPGDLAYLIYTSGSTGQPKGVQVTQGGVLNFFAGMDRLLAPKAEAAGRWLAVTSLSFDISVLELLWTLARGYTVVIHDAAAPAVTASASAPASASASAAAPRPEVVTQFSLFYFASEDGAPRDDGEESPQGPLPAPARPERDAYRLLLEGARFADRHGFAAVWTPERHFHGFGGPFPNPALAAAALAMVTRRVQLRAGSCVLPLHHPLSVAEDWALVDRLSGGRVGVSFAAGWQPQDFVLAPQAWAGRREQLFAGIDAVRRLWRGEAMAWPGPEGRTVSVRTLPRPVQPELPVWVTAAGNPETFAEAGRAGCHLLTHLLGQSAQELAPKIAAYRDAWQAAGHPGRGQVALMLHALVGDDEDAMREAARGPLKAYLRSAMDLIRRADWRFPTFGPPGAQAGAAAGVIPGALSDLADRPPSPEETEALLEHAFDRYWRGSALIGSPARCLALVDALRAQGVDEIACLIDFGVDAGQALAHLPDLHRLMRLAQRQTREVRQPPAPALPALPVPPVLPVAARALSVASAIRRAGITHLQCTPSQAAILLVDEPGRQALSQLEVLLVGGEALPPAMARALRARVPGQVLNMYGPTEATVWCSAWPLPSHGPGAGEEAVSLGRPLANVTLHLRNAWGQECPAFVPGELCVGGAGLARGYHARPTLDAQRFIDDPLCPGRRLYRTGDQVRRLPDGTLAFLGRLDHQVKIRGHRIELGEIEAVLAREEGVREAVVVACQGGAGEGWLQAFVTARPGRLPQPLDLSRALARQLPEFMLPRGIALRDRLPLTPNGKVDRQALAASGEARPAHPPHPSHALPEPPAEAERAAADTRATLRRLEALVGGVWRGVLARQDVGREANFFDMGGHSLAVLQVQRRLREATGIEIAITDMFRLTTVAAQARYLAAQQAPAQRLSALAAAAASAPVLNGMALPGAAPATPSPPGPLPISLGQGRAQARRALRTSLPG